MYQNIFQIVHQNILDCIPKYFRLCFEIISYFRVPTPTPTRDYIKLCHSLKIIIDVDL